MKLNIGCGLEYKKGYVNVDAYNDTVADRVMSVTNLEFESRSFSHVDCIQVVEHLGAAKSIYSVSEIYRVLKPEGTFLLETPDLISSFKNFIKGNEDSRKLIMNWIYGLDMPGMSHKYGFPEELLEKMLQEAGFIDIEISQIKPKSVHPSLRATCRKDDSRIHQTIAQFRKNLIEKKKICLDNQIEAIEHETLIRKLTQLTLSTGQTFIDKYLKSIVETSALHSPKIGQVFLETVTDEKLVDSNATSWSIDILRDLDSLNFIGVLTYLFSEMPIKPGFQNDTFDVVLQLGKQLVRKFIIGDQNAINEIKNTASRIKDEEYGDYFSMIGLELISNRKLALGLKAFGLNQFEDAINLLHDAVRFNRDSVIAYWNLARLSVLKQSSAKIDQYYSTVENLLRLKHPTSYRTYVKSVEKERKYAESGSEKIYSRPIYSY